MGMLTGRKKSEIYRMHVYVLLCPTTHKPRYVGLTRDPEQRLNQIWIASGKDCPLRRWIRGLRAAGSERPTMVVIDSGRFWLGMGAEALEKHWIKRISGNVGSQLLNIVHGPQKRKPRPRKYEAPAHDWCI